MLAIAAELPAMERPRAMVVVGTDTGVDTAFLTALVGRTAPAPILAASTLPPWVGPLDLVVVLSAHADDEQAAQAAGIARRRGATLVVRGAESGPVAEAAGRSLIAPVIAVPETLAVCARLALLAVIAARAGLGPAVELARTADLLDATALACHPDAENWLNPGVNLAEYLSEGTPLLVGCDRLADAIAAHGVRALADLGGLAAGLMTSTQGQASPALLRRIGGRKDLFADPDDDDEPTQLVKPLLVSTTAADTSGAAPAVAADRIALAGMLRSFTGAMHLDGSSDALPAVAGLPPNQGFGDGASREWAAVGPAVHGQPASEFDAAIAACLRLDFAAVYTGMATGQLVPLDFPDGLGRLGGTRWAVRPASVGDRREREQGGTSWN